MKIVRSGNCGNSPKNAFVEESAIQLIAGLCRSRTSASGEKFEVRVYGEPFDSEPDEIVVFQAISHGKAGAANGEARLGEKTLGFAIAMTFASAKGDRAKEINVYVGAANQ